MVTMTDDIVTWLRAQLDEDERELYLAGARGERWPHPGFRWLIQDIEAKRRLIYQFEHRGNSVRATVKPATGGVWDDLLRMLALPYADRDGYRAEWRP